MGGDWPFDFTNDAVNNINNQIVFMFDFGTQGDGSSNSTYLFDDITQSLGTTPVLILPVLPLDFESTTVAYPFVDFCRRAGVNNSKPTNFRNKY